MDVRDVIDRSGLFFFTIDGKKDKLPNLKIGDTIAITTGINTFITTITKADRIKCLCECGGILVIQVEDGSTDLIKSGAKVELC